MSILAIDPGPEQSAYVLMDGYKPVTFGKFANRAILTQIGVWNHDILVIECIASYGMAVGKEVFEACYWIGRFMQEEARGMGRDAQRLYRKDVKMHLCQSMRAKDSNIRQALIDRFGEVGTKKNPGWFYGFKADIWSAYAVGVTFTDLCRNSGD